MPMMQPPTMEVISSRGLMRLSWIRVLRPHCRMRCTVSIAAYTYGFPYSALCTSAYTLGPRGGHCPPPPSKQSLPPGYGFEPHVGSRMCHKGKPRHTVHWQCVLLVDRSSLVQWMERLGGRGGGLCVCIAREDRSAPAECRRHRVRPPPKRWAAPGRPPAEVLHGLVHRVLKPLLGGRQRQAAARTGPVEGGGGEGGRSPREEGVGSYGGPAGNFPWSLGSLWCA